MTATEDLRQELISINAGIGQAIRAIDVLDTNTINIALTAMQTHLDRAKVIVPLLIHGQQPLALSIPVQTFAQGSQVDYQLNITGGTQPYHVIWSGNLPANLTLDDHGHLTGTLIAAPNQIFVVDVLVLDANNAFVSGTLEIHVTP